MDWLNTVVTSNFQIQNTKLTLLSGDLKSGCYFMENEYISKWASHQVIVKMEDP